LREAEWVVYAKRPFRRTRAGIGYVGRYTHRVAISNNRLSDIAEDKVTFRYKDYRHDSQQKTMTLEAEEFIRRFLLHVLPEGFQRIRYYGFLANRYREQKLTHCRELLDMPAPEPPALDGAKNYRERYEELTGCSLWQCPVCHKVVCWRLRSCPEITAGRQRSRIPHDEEDCYEMQIKLLRASLAEPSARSSVCAGIMSKSMQGKHALRRRTYKLL
jgi:hypothetical protein